MKQYRIRSRAIRTGFISHGTGRYGKLQAEQIVASMNGEEKRRPLDEQLEEWTVEKVDEPPQHE